MTSREDLEVACFGVLSDSLLLGPLTAQFQVAQWLVQGNYTGPKEIYTRLLLEITF